MDDARPVLPARTYRSGAIDIDASRRQVFVDGRLAKIGPRAFAVLLALIERRDRVVPKRELMDVVWPRLVVEENNLLVHIVALRKLFGPHAIETIPGRGYRFVMPVEVDDAGGPTTSALPNRGNLPASPALIGRAEDLDAVDALLRKHAVVTIVGAGGIGKTRLAMAAAAIVAARGVPDGCWWVELAAINEGAQVPSTIAAALGLQLPPGRLPHEAIVAELARRKLLLTLDGCEHIAEDVASLIDSLRAGAPNVRLLLSSQESLKCRDEQVYRLGPLAVPASAQLEEAAQFGAVALFVERAHAVDPRFLLSDDNVVLVIDICRRLDGIPLAIELAAARVPLLGLLGLHARLDQMFNVLTGGARMKLRRHQTLRAALEWSHSLLAQDEQTVFRRLGVFAGGFTLELAQAAIGDERIDRWLALDLLGHLIDKSLVIADGASEPRYRLLETTRAFALEQLAASGESEALLRRHAEVVCKLMATIDAHHWNLSAAERDSCLHELGNLRAALDWTSSSAGDRMLACELLGKCWFVLMQNGLSREAVHRMRQQWPLPASLPAVVEADFCRGYARLNKNAACEEHWQAALRAETLYRQLGDAEGLYTALLLVATIGALGDRLPEASRAMRDAEALIDETAPSRKRASLAGAQGELYLRLGAPEQAIAAFRRQGELLRDAGDVLGEFVAQGNLGCAELDAGELDAAIGSLSASVDGLRSIRAPYGLEFRLSTLAVAIAWRGDDRDILPLARESFDNLRLLGVTFAPLIAAALQHAGREDAERAVMICGYALARLPHERHTRVIALPLQQRIRDHASTQHASTRVDAWLRQGERLTEQQAAAIAFDAARLPFGREAPHTRRIAADSRSPVQ